MAVAASALHADRLRRHIALGVVLVLLALAGYANATVKRHRAEAAVAPASAIAEVVVSHQASSSAWYCPGPLPLDVGKETAAIELANVSQHTVRGELDLVTDSGTSALHAVTLPPRSTVWTSFPTPKHPGWGAASVLLNGLGVGVSEIEQGAAGPVSTACTTTSTDSTAIAGGSTRLASNVALALFDPGATPTVANISFATGGGVVAPPAFQGIAVGAGQLVVENVGEYLPQQGNIATTITSSGGRVVAGTMDSSVLDNTRILGFAIGAANSTAGVVSPPAPSGGSAAQSFVVYNTSAKSTEVALRTANNGSALEVATTLKQVGAGATAQFNLARDAGPGTLRWAEVSASGGAAIVVTRTVQIARPISVPSIVQKHSAPGKAATLARSPYLLPATVPPGASESAGSPLLARRWLLGGGESDAQASEVVTLANPTALAVSVHVSALGADGAVDKALAGVATIGLAPQSVLPIDLAALVDSAPELTLVVSASAPIACGADLYVRGSNGSVGFNASAAIPVE